MHCESRDYCERVVIWVIRIEGSLYMSWVDHNCKNDGGLYLCWVIVTFVVAERMSLLRLVYRILSLKFILLDPDRAITARFILSPTVS